MHRLRPLLFISFLIAILIMPFGLVDAQSFDDTQDHWAEADIEQAVEIGYINGYNDGTFRPDEPLTRAAFTKMLAAALDLDRRSDAAPSFQDTGDHWVHTQGWLEAAVAQGIVVPSAYPDRHFDPDRPITRVEIATMVVRAMGLDAEARKHTDADLDFDDAAMIDARATGYVSMAVEQGMVTGFTDHTFRPNAEATRAQAVVMVQRMLKSTGQRPRSDLDDESGELTVHFIDVGQGNSVLVELPNGKTLLYDGGDREAGPVVVDYLNRQGIKTLDAVVASHADADHIGGLIEVLSSVDVKTVYDAGYPHTTQTYADFLDAVDESGASYVTPRQGDSIDLSDDVDFTVRYPRELGDTTNESTLVLDLTYGAFSVLLTGDAEAEQEAAMLRWGVLSPVDVLQVGHHGSNTSSTQAFLNTIDPDVAVIPVGADNAYGHPDPQVLERLQRVGAVLYRTDQNGTVVFTSDGETYHHEANQGEGVVPTPEPDTPPVAADPSVQITGVDKADEVVTIQNTGDEAVDLTGWQLESERGGQTFAFPQGYSLDAGATVRIVSGRGAEANPPAVLEWTGAYLWNNDASDPAVLSNAQGEVVSRWP